VIKALIATIVYDLKRVTNVWFRTENASGYLLEAGYLSSEVCNEIYNKVKTLLSNSNDLQSGIFIDKRGWLGHDEGMIDIKNIDHFMPELTGFINIDDILYKLKSFTHKKIRIESIHCYYNHGVTNTRRLHVDSHTKSQYKAFIYITDVLSEDYGPYCYVPNSANFTITRYFSIIKNFCAKKPLTDFDNKINRMKMKQLCGPKGSLIVSNQNGAHRGWPQKKNRERMLIALNLVEH